MEKDMENQETTKKTFVERVLRGIMRPFLHVGAELFGTGALAFSLMLGLAVGVCLAILAIGWIRGGAGIQPDSVQDVILTITACGGAVWVLIKEMNRFSGQIRAWTDRLHAWIEGV